MPSSVIRGFSYDPAQRVLTVTFVSGRVYRYENVQADVVSSFRNASSKGEFFNARIRDRYAFSEIRQSA